LAQLVNPGLEGFNFLRLLMGLAHQGSNFGLLCCLLIATPVKPGWQHLYLVFKGCNLLHGAISLRMWLGYGWRFWRSSGLWCRELLLGICAVALDGAS